MTASDDVTRFGAQWSPLDRAVAVLRARANRFGAHSDARLDELDAAAAVVAVDAWMLALGAETLDRPARYGDAAVMALSAALSRAAGGAGAPQREIDAADVAPDAWLLSAERYQAWAADVTTDSAEVLRRAASDLSGGASDPRLATMADTLARLAELP